MSQSSAGKMRLWLLLTGFAAFFFVSVGLAGVLYLALRGRGPAPQPLPIAEPSVSHLDKMLGTEPINGIDEDGFHNPEKSGIWKGETFRWSNGAAKLIVPPGDRPPQAVYVRLGLTVPRMVHLRVQINGKLFFDEKFRMAAEWSRTFDVSGMNLGKAITIEVVSDTTMPAEFFKNTTDTRALGVCVRGILLMSGEQDFADVLIGARSVPCVAEEGFYYKEYYDKEKPCRWTNGAASLTVPIHGSAPKLLSVMCTIPNLPAFRVHVKVNGKTLFDDAVKGNADWSISLPLDGVAITREARIEIISSTVVPADAGSGSKDTRTLGIRMKRLMLVRDPGI
jgi:hypothetical protein